MAVVGGRGRGRGSGRGLGGCGYDRGHERGGRSSGRRDHNPNLTKVTYNADLLPDQSTVDHVNSSIAHKYITQNKIFVNKGTYNVMSKTKRHAVFQIREDLNKRKDPLAGIGKKRDSELAALHRSVLEMNTRMDNHYGPVLQMDDQYEGGGCYERQPDLGSSRSNKGQPGLVRQSRKKYKTDRT